MCPQARKGDDAEVGTGEGASRGCAAEVKAEAMRAVERQQRLNEALGVNLGASRAGADGATGVNPDQHLPRVLAEQGAQERHQASQNQEDGPQPG